MNGIIMTKDFEKKAEFRKVRSGGWKWRKEN